ncbi:alpha/beta fold hydrolase [Streptomyces klenkii]
MPGRPEDTRARTNAHARPIGHTELKAVRRHRYPDADRATRPVPQRVRQPFLENPVRGPGGRGVLLLNPGGPGGPGLDLPVSVGADFPGEVKRQYDLIGFDPRGVGRSSPVSCGLTGDEQDMERPYKTGTFAKDVEWARTVAAKCQAGEGDRLRHLTTRNTARDMDVIRAVLGEKKISYLGFSYGTYLGAVYTQMFPRRTNRFVLDSAADPARYGRGMFQAMAERAGPAFTRWTEWTARRHTTYGLGHTPAQVRKTFWDLIAQADRKPIDYGGTFFTGDSIRAQRAMFSRVQKAATWVAGLKKAAEGEKPDPPGTPEQVPSPLRPASARDVPSDNETASAWAVLCADTRTSWPHDSEQYRRDASRDKARYPLSGDFESSIKPCAFWEPGSEPETTVTNRVRALILQNEWDPSTPPAGRARRRTPAAGPPGRKQVVQLKRCGCVRAPGGATTRRPSSVVADAGRLKAVQGKASSGPKGSPRYA